jgi:hypothetical protein
VETGTSLEYSEHTRSGTNLLLVNRYNNILLLEQVDFRRPLADARITFLLAVLEINIDAKTQLISTHFFT